MRIINKSIRIIDYETNKVIEKDIPDSFDEYIVEMIAYVNGNDKVRTYRTRSMDTLVVSNALKILNNLDNYTIVKNCIDDNAIYLLEVERESQERIKRMNVNIRKGSLIQALLYNDEENTFSFLLAKVEHSNFIDDNDFIFKTGFSKDKKDIWKTCVLDMSNLDADVLDAKVYTDKKATYWGSGFLELDVMTNDETNTLNSFKAIDAILNRSIKKHAPQDYTCIRNCFVGYYRNHEFINFDVMVDSILQGYQGESLEEMDAIKLYQDIKTLPEKKNFDKQFNSVPSEINARIKKVYNVNNGIELRITKEIPNISNTIKGIKKEDGSLYLQILTNEETYKFFK